MANFFQLVLSMICTESPSPPRFANFKIILSPKGVVNAHNNCNCKDDKKAVLIGYSDHALEGGECFAHEHYWVSIEENFSSIFRSFS
jgi:hypothetical protein